LHFFMPRDKNFLPSQCDVRRYFEDQSWIFMFEVLQHKGSALTQNVVLLTAVFKLCRTYGMRQSILTVLENK
jgi:hypothetical protein